MKLTHCIRQKADPELIRRNQARIRAKRAELEYTANILAMAGNEVRLSILWLLHLEKKLCVCDLSDILGMNISAISQHLRKMKDRNMIRSQREAQTIYYSLSDESETYVSPMIQLISDTQAVIS